MLNAGDPWGLLFVGHGTRDPHGTREFLRLAELTAARFGDLPTAACFLELQPPDILAGVQQLLARGVRRMVVAPALLFCAGHAKADIPAAVGEGLAGRADVFWTQSPPLECHPEVMTLAEERVLALAETTSSTAGGDDCLVVVARGSSDAQAQGAVREFVAARQRQHPDWRVSHAFVAAATPRLPEELDRVATLRPQRVILQPHLLFQGEVLATVRAAAERMRATHPQTEWQAADHLGWGLLNDGACAARLASAYAERIQAVMG